MSRGDNLACFQVPANHRWGKKVNTTMAAVSLPVCYFHGAARDAHATYRDVLTPLDVTLTDYEPPARQRHQTDASACEPASEPDRTRWLNKKTVVFSSCSGAFGPCCQGRRRSRG